MAESLCAPTDLASCVCVACHGARGTRYAYGHCSLAHRCGSFHWSARRNRSGWSRPKMLPWSFERTGLCAEALPEVHGPPVHLSSRRDVSGIARFQSPQVTTLSNARLDTGADTASVAYFAPSATSQCDPRLVGIGSAATSVMTRILHCDMSCGGMGDHCSASIEEALCLACISKTLPRGAGKSGERARMALVLTGRSKRPAVTSAYYQESNRWVCGSSAG